MHNALGSIHSTEGDWGRGRHSPTCPDSQTRETQETTLQILDKICSGSVIPVLGFHLAKQLWPMLVTHLLPRAVPGLSQLRPLGDPVPEPQRPPVPGRALYHSVSGSCTPGRRGGLGSEHGAREEPVGFQLGSGMEREGSARCQLNNTEPFPCLSLSSPSFLTSGCRAGSSYR